MNRKGRVESIKDTTFEKFNFEWIWDKKKEYTVVTENAFIFYLSFKKMLFRVYQ